MRWKRTRNYLISDGGFERLINDVLTLILEQVTSTQDLRSLSLVSRRLYLHTVPILYRKIDLDLSRSSHHSLLRQLARRKSLRPSLIRRLSVKSLNGDHADAARDLCALFLKLSYFHELSWNSVLAAPRTILDTLTTRFPRARLLLTVTDNFSKWQSNPMSWEGLNMTRILQHPACLLLTHFHFAPGKAGRFPSTFKVDLIRMLTRNRVLKSLCVYAVFDMTVGFPDMSEFLQQQCLPKLENLQLHVFHDMLFTSRELAYWGSRGGWENLTSLSLYQVPQLLPFLGRAPKLRKLQIFSLIYDDMDLIDHHMAHEVGTNSFFPSLDELRFIPHSIPEYVPHQRAVAPWAILKRAPQLTVLDISRQHLPDGVVGISLATPTVSEIQQIRRYCPGLTKLRLNVRLIGNVAKWPHHILRELAAFQQPIELGLFLHQVEPRGATITNDRGSFSLALWYVNRERKRLHLSCKEPFSVGFRIVRPWKKMQPYWDSYSHAGASARLQKFEMDAPRERLTDMSLERLKEKKQKQFSMKIGWDRRGYGKEIRLREQTNSEDTDGDAEVVLYDVWA
ncbi:hypothetical protein BDW02DRAFT_598307 [Decorospora gaudefroyi]|uniref:F-box domain-containing protein n=1 Tax=Decorospora gaudefroyi TaxID=184978 RepID=A0A6A5KDF3_9PLEO|nr:hypothetical protein BDW02DRAFT_598307 [Decorospora gaudefroyi]